MLQSFETMPKYHELMWPVVVALREMGRSGSVNDIFDKVVEMYNISEEVQSEPISSQKNISKLRDRISLALTYLKKGQAVDNSARGVWALTKSGVDLNEEQTIEINKMVRHNNYKKKKRNGQGFNERYAEKFDNPTDLDEESIPEEIEDSSPTRKTWKDELLEILKAMDPYAFERLSQRILKESGLDQVEVSGGPGDGGIDGQGILRINLISFRVFFQCKKYTGTVKSPDIRNFRGAMAGRGDKGIFITTGDFTSDAKKEATRAGAPEIDLIDGEKLCGILKDLQIGVKTDIVIIPEFFDEI